MRKFVLIVLASLMALSLVPAAHAEDELRVLIWSEYMPEDFMERFEKDTDIKARVEYYESMEEMVAKLQAGGKNQYDVIVPSDYMLPAIIKLGLVRELDHSKIPNLKNLKPTFVNPPYDPGNKYAAAYQWGTLGLYYNTEKVKDYDESYSLVFDKDKRQGPFVLIDTTREMLGIGLIYLGLDPNTTDKNDLKKLLDLMLEAKHSDYFVGFDVGTGGRANVMAGTALAAVVYNGDALRAVAENPNTRFINPKEGTVVWVDNMAIPVGAPHPEAAHTFINWVLDGKIGAYLSNWTQYPTPNKAADEFINPEDFKNPAIYPSEEYMSKLKFLKDLGNDNKLYDEIWTMIKTQ